MRPIGNGFVGEFFGEKAIEENTYRAATVLVNSETCLVASLTKNDYVAAVGDAFKNLRDKEIAVLRNFGLLNSFSKRKLAEWYYLFDERKFHMGQSLYS